jgi:hypothetical protein
MDTHRDLNLGEDAPTYRTETELEGDDLDDKKLLRKLDWHILPQLSLLYLLCFLDRA